jgi:proteasome lid subunit RPN8/RPN11
MRLEKDIKLILSDAILEEAVECVKQATPNEACGLIFGNKKEIENPEKENDFFYHYIGKQFECIKSDEESPVAFLINNLDKLNKIYSRAHKKYNMGLLSIFHSHPGESNYPSGIDKDNMKRLENSELKSFKGVIWSIIASQNHQMNAFMYLNQEFIQTEIIIKNP